MPTEPASLDPALAEDGASLTVLCNTMEGLVYYDGGGELRNGLAESYRVSADGLRYEFKLRPDARWSDGVPVKPADFVTAFRRALDPRTGSRLAGSLFPIRGARARLAGQGAAELGVREDHGKLVIELTQARPYFIQALTLPVAMPERQDVLDAHQGHWPETAPGTGAYRIARHDSDRAIRFEKNTYYYATAPGAPDVDMLIVNDDAAALSLFEAGGLDVLSRVSASDLPRLRRQHPEAVRTEPFLATYYLSFNFRQPPFDDPVWRRAVAGAVRRDEIVRALDAGEQPARSWVPPGLEGFIPYVDPASAYAADVAQVHARVAVGGPGGGAARAIEAVFDASARNTLVMEKVQADLKRALGLSVSLTSLDWKTYLKTVHTQPPALFRLGILSPFMDPIQILESFTTGNPNNYLRWSDAAYDAAVAEVARLAPGPARVAKIREAQAILVDRAAIVVPVYHYVENHAVSARVEGFRANAFGVTRFRELRIGGPDASH